MVSSGQGSGQEPNGKELGKKGRDRALSALIHFRAYYVKQAKRAFVGKLLETGAATMDAIRDVVILPEGVNPKLFGCVPTGLRSAGVIEFDGFTQSNRKESHARTLARWKLKDREVAVSWLQDNPLPDEPPAAPESLVACDVGGGI